MAKRVTIEVHEDEPVLTPAQWETFVENIRDVARNFLESHEYEIETENNYRG